MLKRSLRVLRAAAVVLLVLPLAGWTAEAPDDVWNGLTHKGQSLRQAGNYLESEKTFDAAAKVCERCRETELCLARTRMLKAGLFLASRRYAESEALYRQAVPEFEKVYAADSLERAALYDNLSIVLSAQSKLSEAEVYSKRALEVFETNKQTPLGDLLYCYNNVSGLQREQHKLAEAQITLQKAIREAEASDGMPPAFVATLYDNLGGILMDAGDIKEAEKVRRQALGKFEQALGSNHPEVAVCLMNLGASVFRQGRADEAAALCKRALDINRVALGPHSKPYLQGLAIFARVLRQAGRDAEAGEVERELSATTSGSAGKESGAQGREGTASTSR